MLRELDDLYIPTNERELRNIQRKGDELERIVRNWALSVTGLLPRGLPINNDETMVLSLFLAQQRRLNLQMDDGRPDSSLLATVKRSLLFESPADPDTRRAIHRIVSTRLESDVDRTCNFFCSDNGIPPDADPAIDWRVSIRFMAQSIFSRVANVDPKKMATSPRRFELAIVSRDLASEVADKRYRMFQLLAVRPA